MSKKDEDSKALSPMENFFNLPPSPKKEEKEVAKKVEVAEPTYDKKDISNEELFTIIHEAAMHSHNKLLDELEDMEPGDGMKNYVVANGFLETALKAAEKRAKLKEHKDKLMAKTTKVATGTTITNNTLTINTTDLIKQLTGDMIEGEVVSEINPQDNKNNE